MNYKIPLAFILIYFIWGSTFTAIKYGLDAFPPFLLAGMRFILAGSIFFLASKWKDLKTMSFQDFSKDMKVGLLLTLGNGGVCWAEQFISSGVAALIVGTLPVMFMLFNWFSFEKKIPHYSSIFAFIMGLTGIALISMDAASATDWRIVLGLLLGNTCWVTGSLMFRMSKSHLQELSLFKYISFCFNFKKFYFSIFNRQEIWKTT
jgi:drug/metabolite transporter (DMT)-like permease